MAKKKELILHIGRAKSGTSTLQRYLTAQREVLAAQGICYPRSGTAGRFAHHDIAHTCRSLIPFNPRAREMREAFEAEVAPFDKVIVSSEALQSVIVTQNLYFFFGGRDAGPLKSLLFWSVPSLRERPYDIRVICYIREYLDFACSSYAQRIHATSYDDSLEGYCRRHFRRPLWSLVRLWRHFADDSQFLYYERNRLHDQDIIADFFWRAGLMPPAPSSSHDANPSLSGNLLAFKRLLNYHGCHSMALYNTFSQLARLDPRYRGKIFVSDALAANLRDSDRGYNAQLSRLVGEIGHHSFESGNRFDPAMWKLDMERFLEHPKLASLKNRPDIYRTSASDIAALLGR
jgi:hypothetical protein